MNSFAQSECRTRPRPPAQRGRLSVPPGPAPSTSGGRESERPSGPEGRAPADRQAAGRRDWHARRLYLPFTIRCLLALSLAQAALGQGLVLELRQSAVGFNVQWPLGGRPPLDLPATASQFESAVLAGAVAAPKQPSEDSSANVTKLVPGRNLAANAANIGLPVGRNAQGQIQVVLLAATVGAPYLGQQVSFFFGAVIPVPETDELGVALAQRNPPVRPEDYWQAEPHSTDNHQSARYYWSSHARRVFANQAGQVTIIWRGAIPRLAQPAGENGRDWVQEGAAYYVLHTARYLVSSSAAKPPRKIYWTEGVFRAWGQPVNVPTARVGDIQIAYNSNFRQRVDLTEVFRPPGQVTITDPSDPTRQALEETRTLWYDAQQGQIYAYNLEGRVLMEILGDRKPDGRSRQHLGLEIVDVIQQANPVAAVAELGERLLPSDNEHEINVLFPLPIDPPGGQPFYFRQTHEGTDRVTLYATRETFNLNDLLVHWLEEGVAGLRWPFRLVRYRLHWPTDVARYSHYLRPLVTTEADARATAVPLPMDNVPVIEYQDLFGGTRAKLTEDFRFYTFLDSSVPVHRTLLRFSAADQVRFERVLSWLDLALKEPARLGNTFVTGLTASEPDTGASHVIWDDHAATLRFPAGLPPAAISPRVVEQVVVVGERIRAPAGELGGADQAGYWAGYVRFVGTLGASFSPSAYVDPFVKGFEEANRGSIIPVNAPPGNDRLEVWWFRRNRADEASGFKPIYWPAVLGRYRLTWPVGARQIILASNDGSGPLTSLEAKGRLYFQNNRDLPGYNPNEEHALLQGGQVYALRDDLNLTDPAFPNRYSSAPFVLLEYTAADGRPAMTVFEVVRERPDLGITFDYAVTAGTILQPPMPLPLLEKPLAVRKVGEPPLSMNTEVLPSRVQANRAEGSHIVIELGRLHFFRAGQTVFLQDDLSGDALRTQMFFVGQADGAAGTLAGWPMDQRPVTLGAWGEDPPQDGPTWRFLLPAGGAAAFAQDQEVRLATTDSEGTLRVVAARVFRVNVSEGWIDFRFSGDSPGDVPEHVRNAVRALAVIPSGNVENNHWQNWRLATEPLPERVNDNNLQEFYASFTLQDRKGNLWVYRGPHSEQEQPELQMQFYYKTLPGFFFPSLQLNQQPPVGSITPYLRLRSQADGAYVGDAVRADANKDGLGDAQALAIRYRPIWPTTSPVMFRAETLTLPRRGLPAVRGQTSLQVVYQQSHTVGGLAHLSVRLHDPTREKQFALAPAGDARALDALPDSVRTQNFRGKTYFPNLPPHLSERFFFDPHRGENGALVLAGRFVDAPLGDDYVLLNVLGNRDRKELKALCLAEDPRKTKWDAAIDGLSTTLELFHEDPARPGTFVPDHSRDVPVAAGELAVITDDDVAVDSYALTALGPGAGFVTLIAGNGRAFTPPDEPVSVLIIRVSDKLYRGELKVIESSNPLSERLTLQQVVDLAGQTDQFEFDWKITAPVDGLPPAVYENRRVLLLGDEAWQHLNFPTSADLVGQLEAVSPRRLTSTPAGSVVPVESVAFSAASREDDLFVFQVPAGQDHRLQPGARLVARDGLGRQVLGTVGLQTTPSAIVLVPDADQRELPAADDIRQLAEAAEANRVQSFLFRTFSRPDDAAYRAVWLSLDLSPGLGARVYLDGQLVVSANLGSEDTATSAPTADLLPLPKVYRLSPERLGGGKSVASQREHVVAVELFSSAQPEVLQSFNLRLEAHEAQDLTEAPGSPWLPLASERFEDGVRAILGGTADVRSLADNYLIMRYRPKAPPNANWSQWTEPQLAEGWIKRVLKGINPFNQRLTDLFNNRVNTDVSLIAQAGPRWEGDVALNLESINSFGLIEIYETVLRRGKMLSIGAGINYGPANDALLLAAGYLNDLYMLLGNEAWADAANPTIGIGTKDRTYGEIATALFAFRGQVASLLEEELALLRGRDDFLQPGVETRPVYNRLVWNYTRGIDAGEVIYALNYNIQEQQDTGVDGIIDADDARRMFPQGHGDGYGHYLTALKGYYSLLMDTDFDWVPRIEAVLVLGKPVSVDFQDERKFAAAAAALARTGRQIFDLTWRRDYRPGTASGWAHFQATRTNNRRALPTTRYWGMDHWASRVAQGAYLNWVVGNAILPDRDPDPTHEGIQKVDRTTVPELKELTALAEDLQTAMDNAEAGHSPLGLPEDALAFDINPNAVTGANPTTHFEQLYDRATQALRNAVAAFDDAKDVTRLLRSEQDSLAEFQTQVARQELAYEHSLIELYGTPYPDDIGPGRTYPTGYEGPDLIHFMYVDLPELTFPGLVEPREPVTYQIDFQPYPENFLRVLAEEFNDIVHQVDDAEFLNDGGNYTEGEHFIGFTLNPHGFFGKPNTWKSRRPSPGRLQQAISDIIKARTRLHATLNDADGAKDDLDKGIQMFNYWKATKADIRSLERDLLIAKQTLMSAELVNEIIDLVLDSIKEDIVTSQNVVKEALPKSLIAGLAAGGDLTSAARSVIEASGLVFKKVVDWKKIIRQGVIKGFKFATETSEMWVNFDQIAPKDLSLETREKIIGLGDLLWKTQIQLFNINQRLQELDDAQRNYRALLAQGERIQREREIFRRRAAAVIQGFRTRDAAFRIFRNEKLERYKTLFDLAARYTLLAANAYDYETGLLGTPEGREFVRRIIAARALGVVRDGLPQFAGSNLGDPGLSSVLAEMKADWDVLKGRLGFNNPDGYGTTLSLRTEQFRILPGAEGQTAWRDLLHRARMDDLLADPDVRRHCLQLDRGSGLPVPGLLLSFSTTVADGLNLFGRPLAAGDHAFSSSSFATKIFAVGVALEGYRGMDDPAANSSAIGAAGGSSPPDPPSWFLDPLALSATPYVYLIPVGVDSLRVPPLGDAAGVRTWRVADVAVPLPFNIGGSDFASGRFWQSSDSLPELLFAVRKHQAFRPVSSAAVFDRDIFGAFGQLRPSQFTNRRLIGRSVWNSQWKLVIPGHTLLNDPKQGLDRFIQTVRDIKLHFVTYSYAGN